MNMTKPAKIPARLNKSSEHVHQTAIKLIYAAIVHTYETGDTWRVNELFSILARQNKTSLRKFYVPLLKSLLPYEVKEKSKNLFEIPQGAKRDDEKYKSLTTPEDNEYWETKIDEYLDHHFPKSKIRYSTSR